MEGYPKSMHAAGLASLHSVALQQKPSGLYCKHAATTGTCTACVVVLGHFILSLQAEGQTMVGMLTKVSGLHLEGAKTQIFNT